jgi:hypothetical protein
MQQQKQQKQQKQQLLQMKGQGQQQQGQIAGMEKYSGGQLPLPKGSLSATPSPNRSGRGGSSPDISPEGPEATAASLASPWNPWQCAIEDYTPIRRIRDRRIRDRGQDEWTEEEGEGGCWTDEQLERQSRRYAEAVGPSSKGVPARELELALVEEERRQQQDKEAEEEKDAAAVKRAAGSRVETTPEQAPAEKDLPYPFRRECTEMSPEEKAAMHQEPVELVC